MESILSDVQNLIPPAIIVVIVAYLVRFWGKVISDQKAYSDERGWEIEISGTIFFINIVLFYGIIGVFIGTELGDFGLNPWIRFFLVLISVGWLWIIAGLHGEKVYETKRSLPALFIKKLIKSENPEKITDTFLKVSRVIPTPLFSIFFFYVITIEYTLNNAVFLVLDTTQIFMGFLFMALIYSLLKTRLQKVDVYFTDEKNLIQNATLLKITPLDIRIKEDDQVTIINRTSVKKIDIFPPALDKK